MQLFYAPHFTEPLYTLSEDESKHCVRVLRLACGDTLHITDGCGTMFRCVVDDAHPKRCTVRVVERHECYDQLPYDLTVAVAPTKNSDRYEWFLEKATEIGITTFAPILTSRSERKSVKADREMRVITSAMKQSLKAYHPTLRPLQSFAEFLQSLPSGPSCGSTGGTLQRFIAHCNAPQGDQDLKPNLNKLVAMGGEVVVMIGPEGDFSVEEVQLALQHGFVEVSLGSQRLRTETAALMAVAIVAAANMD